MMFSFTVLAFLVNLVIAAPSIDFQLTPGKNPLDVVATVTNTGNGPISVMKLSPILSTIPVKRLRMFDGQGSELPFQGISVFYDIEGAGADAWEIIPAGKSIVRPIDLTASHELKSVGQYTLWANGRLQALDGPYSKELAQSQTLYSYNKNLTLSLTKSDVATSTERRILQKRVKIGACDANQQNSLRTDFGSAKQLASRAAERTRALDGHFSQFFHTTDPRYVGMVADKFQKISDAATVSATSPITANCNGSPNVCTANVLAYAEFYIGVEGQGNIYTCPPFWNLPPNAPTCSGYGQADVLVHELSHLYGTDDVIYGYDQSQRLNTNDAVRNADTYMFYSRSLAC